MPECVGCPQPLDVTSATGLQRAIAAARSSPLGQHPDSFIYSTEPPFVPAGSVAVAYRREVFEIVGYFDATIVPAAHKRYSVGDRIRRLHALIAASSAEEMTNRLEFLSDWG
jgi:hypothetical protein